MGVWERGDVPVGLSERGHAIPSPREDFVGVDLVGDVPQDAVVGGVEDVVEGDGELNHA